MTGGLNKSTIGAVRHFVFVNVKRIKIDAMLRPRVLHQKVYPVLHRPLPAKIEPLVLFSLAGAHQEFPGWNTEPSAHPQPLQPSEQ